MNFSTPPLLSLSMALSPCLWPPPPGSIVSLCRSPPSRLSLNQRHLRRMEPASRRPLVELTLFFFFSMALLGRERWLYMPLCYILYRMLGSRLAKRIWATLPRDLQYELPLCLRIHCTSPCRGLRLLFKVKRNINSALRRNRPLSAIFLESVQRQPRKPAIVEIETGRQLTLEQLNALCNQYANHFMVSTQQDFDRGFLD